MAVFCVGLNNSIVLWFHISSKCVVSVSMSSHDMGRFLGPLISLSLSLSLYIYIYVYLCVCIYVYVYGSRFQSQNLGVVSDAPDAVLGVGAEADKARIV